MSNPFDQFDEEPVAAAPRRKPAPAPTVEANSFDQFDEAGNEFDAFERETPADEPQPEPRRKRSLVEDVTGFMAGVNRGLGIGDEVAAAGGAVVNALTGRGPQGFGENLARQRELEDDYAAERPKMAALSKGTGNALTMAAPVGPGAAAFASGGKAINALRGATVAGLAGAGFSALDEGSIEERAMAAAETARDPLTLLLGAGAGALASRSGRGREQGPGLDELRIAQGDAYKAADESGVAYSREQFSGLVDDIVTELRKARFNPRRHQKAATMLDDLSDMANTATGTAPTLSELDDLRAIIGRDVSSAPDPGERRMGQIMRERIDSFIDGAGDSADIVRARDYTTRIKKLEKLDGLDEAAGDRAVTSGTGSNGENALRQNVKRFRDSTRNLTAAERNAADRAVRADLGHNALRQVGRLSPEGGTVPAVASLLTGAISPAIPATGFIARRVSEALTQRNVQELRRIIASGGEGASEVRRQITANPSIEEELMQQVANDLSAAAGVQGASARPPIEVNVNRSTHPDFLEWKREHVR